MNILLAFMIYLLGFMSFLLGAMDFLLELYKNFSIPLLIFSLFLIIIIINPIRRWFAELFSNISIKEVGFSSLGIEVKASIRESYDEISKIYNIEEMNNDFSDEISKLLGDKYKFGIPINDSGGGGAPGKEDSLSESVFNSNLFCVAVDSKGCLQEEYNKFGYQETIITLYTFYLYHYKKDLWISNYSQNYSFTNRDIELENKVFKVLTAYYEEAVKGKEERTRADIIYYQKIIRLMLAYYQQNETL